MDPAVLKQQIEKGEYEVDPSAVADAMLRRLRALRSERVLVSDQRPSASTNATPGGPSTTDPTQVAFVNLFALRATGRRRRARSPRPPWRRTVGVDAQVGRDFGDARRRAEASPGAARSAPRCGAPDGRRRWRARRTGRSSRWRRARRARDRPRSAAADGRSARGAPPGSSRPGSRRRARRAPRARRRPRPACR